MNPQAKISPAATASHGILFNIYKTIKYLLWKMYGWLQSCTRDLIFRQKLCNLQIQMLFNANKILHQKMFISKNLWSLLQNWKKTLLIATKTLAANLLNYHFKLFILFFKLYFISFNKTHFEKFTIFFCVQRNFYSKFKALSLDPHYHGKIMGTGFIVTPF